MASFTERNGRHRALVRRGGIVKCATFGTASEAQAWAKRVEREIDQIKATGVITAKSTTIADLIDRYVEELEPVKRWGRSKSADLARLRKDIGHLKASALTAAHLTHYFTKRRNAGAGGVVIGAQLGYLTGVLRTARSLWHLDVPVQAATAAREALMGARMITPSRRRDRRVSDAEIEALTAFFDKAPTKLPMSDILRFCLATGMRISEVCRLRWADLDKSKKTIIVRDRKHPSDKWGNDQTVPLLAAAGFDAFEIVNRQPVSAARVFPVKEKTVGTYFTRAVTELGLGDLHLHDLRHEAISRLFAAGYRIEEVALVSGHRDWKMLARYTHVKAEDLHRDAA